MIITLTPNPALDFSGTVPELVPNEKCYVAHEMRLPGGNGINATRIADRLGGDVFATGLLGGSSCEEFSRHLAHEKIPHHFIKIQDKTRTNITISLESSHEQTRLSFFGQQIKRKETYICTPRNHAVDFFYNIKNGSIYKLYKSLTFPNLFLHLIFKSLA